MIQVAQKTVLHRMSELLCDPESLRFSKPFHDGTGLFVSNGAVLLCFGDIDVPDDLPITRKRDGVWDVTEGGRKPPDRAIEVLAGVSIGVLPLPVVDGPSDELDSLWQQMQECPACEGLGFGTCDMGHEHDCDDCKGAGEYLQEVNEATEPVEFLGATFARRLLWVVSQLPGVRACPEMIGHMLGFTFDGGRGALCELQVKNR
jgi:hypothetical protein